VTALVPDFSPILMSSEDQLEAMFSSSDISRHMITFLTPKTSSVVLPCSRLPHWPWRFVRSGCWRECCKIWGDPSAHSLSWEGASGHRATTHRNLEVIALARGPTKCTDQTQSKRQPQKLCFLALASGTVHLPGDTATLADNSVFKQLPCHFP
jgi:hypothetical protein